MDIHSITNVPSNKDVMAIMVFIWCHGYYGVYLAIVQMFTVIYKTTPIFIQMLILS
jgi:hypothetical protein